MAQSMEEIKKRVGILCLHCGKSQLPPNRAMDNWTCGQCFSSFLSIPMLTNLVSRDVITQIKARPKNPTPGRGCPLCATAMEKVPVRNDIHEVELETCRKCHLLWFDSGKFMQILRLGGTQAGIAKYENLLKEGHPKKPPAEAKMESREGIQIPWGTLALFVLCTLSSALLNHFPQIESQWGFLASSPLRKLGTTFITSLFVNHPSHMYPMALMLFVGFYVEKKLSTPNLIKLFLVAGVVSRLVYLTQGLKQPVFIGATAGVIAVVVYGAMMVPYRELLWPEEKFKSPLATLIGLGVAVLGLALIIVGYDFFHQALVDAKYSDTGVSSSSLLMETGKYFRSAIFRSYLFSGAVGGLFYFSQGVSRKKP